MLGIIIANVLTGIGKIGELVAVSKSTGKKLVIIQAFSYLLYAIATTLLNAYSAIVQNVFGILRNLIAYWDINSRILDALMVILPVTIGILVNNMGPIGLLPILANLLYSYAVLKLINKIVLLKTAFILTNILFAVYCYFILNYVGSVFNVIVAIYGIRALISTIRNEKNKNTEANAQ